MKKILVITDNLPDQVNGVVTTYRNLAKVAHSDGYTIEFIDPTKFPHIRYPVTPQLY